MDEADGDSPSTQLKLNVFHSLVDSLAIRRPILHHLNADSSWLLQLPVPTSALLNGSRGYYNILLDPWLSGRSTTPWLNTQEHIIPSAIQTISELEELAREVDLLTPRPAPRRRSHLFRDDAGTFLDAVIISHASPDHCHKPTLLHIDRNVPIFASPPAVQLITSWNHFRTIISIPGAEDEDWKSYSLPPLPEWIGIARFAPTGDHHSAIAVFFNNRCCEMDEEECEAVFYTPHGISASCLDYLGDLRPRVHILALLHGVDKVGFGPVTVQLGMGNGGLLREVLGAKYWVPTHDGGKIESRWLRWLGWRVRGDAKGVTHVGNGESLVLK
ncbi:hypothetical protein K470DRAFT_258997 [Piedraia hortae CBS 480.64]|uniref:Metallo-beta-lactamase domain-containing protein n=1 Tax=Piedraia hortae CBS 480.64 TaxID=1314780 RepID=A0A6A7BWL7_9PEZI|nr:hypothetical protein K470DRAFT_258997 [Piedraia hortae CBS 480.64]